MQRLISKQQQHLEGLNEHWKTLPDTFFAWLAGFIDGDGCIGVYLNTKHDGEKSWTYEYPRLTIAQKNPEVLFYIQDELRVGGVSRRGKTSTKAVMHNLVFGPGSTRLLLNFLVPYLWEKKSKALEVLARFPAPTFTGV